jgi:hypothetical protein
MIIHFAELSHFCKFLLHYTRRRIMYNTELGRNMNTEAELEVVETLKKQARLLRTASRSTPQISKAAAEWEIKLGGELQRLREQQLLCKSPESAPRAQEVAA